MYNEDCNAPNVTVPQWTHGDANAECTKGWKYFNGIQWIDDPTIRITCTKEFGILTFSKFNSNSVNILLSFNIIEHIFKSP